MIKTPRPHIDTMGILVNAGNSPNTRTLGGILIGIIYQLNSLADDIAKIVAQLARIETNTTPKHILSNRPLRSRRCGDIGNTSANGGNRHESAAPSSLRAMDARKRLRLPVAVHRAPSSSDKDEVFENLIEIYSNRPLSTLRGRSGQSGLRP